MSTPERIDTIRARLTAATPGPWSLGQVTNYEAATVDNYDLGIYEERIPLTDETTVAVLEQLGWDTVSTSHYGDGAAFVAGGAPVVVAPSDHCCGHLADLEVSQPDADLIANAPADLAFLLERAAQLEGLLRDFVDDDGARGLKREAFNSELWCITNHGLEDSCWVALVRYARARHLLGLETRREQDSIRYVRDMWLECDESDQDGAAAAASALLAELGGAA